MDRPFLADQAVCLDVLQQRYARAGEITADDVLQRVARALSAPEDPTRRDIWNRRFLWAMRHGLVPAGRILAGAGTDPSAVMINCFVLPITGPSGLDGTLAEALATLGRGGGVGYDFSALAPVGADLGSPLFPAGGPLKALHELDAACRAMSLHTSRPGAQMAVLRCDHPDVFAFIGAKDAAGLSTFNLSVALTDAFLQAVEADTTLELLHSAKPGGLLGPPLARRKDDGRWVHEVVRARDVWRALLRSGHDHGEPGVLFLDRLNEDNSLSYCESISATNPCAEQPLPAYGACCLASIDLARLVIDPFGARARLDLHRLVVLVKVAVRLLDNVLDLTAWPLNRQKEEARLKRRIGLGITGLGDALVMLGLRYDAVDARCRVAHWMQTMRDAACRASCELAVERGAFPLFDADRFLAAPHFASRLPTDIRQAIGRHGLRHAHLLAVAPAGSISIAMCDNVSSGIEPVFAWQTRRTRGGDPQCGLECLTVDDHAWRLFQQLGGTEATRGDAFVTALELSASDHVAMVAAVAPFVDGGISKTVNVREDLSLEAYERFHWQAWKAGLKGLAAYRQNAILPPALMASSCGRHPRPC